MAPPEEIPNVHYEQLAELEKKFEDVDLEITRQQVKLSAPLYKERELVTARIPNFWPLVVEQAPPDVDMYVQPNDSQALLSSLESLSVAHFDVENGGDPRNIAVRFVFAENDHFTDRVLEKKFWYRRAANGWAGLVSEPVPIHWKSPEKDLTSGLLDRAVAVFEQDQEMRRAGKLKTGPVKHGDYTPEMKDLAKRIEETGHGVMSFFAWFGFRGNPVSAEESRVANEKEKEKRRLFAEGQNPGDGEEDEDDEDEDEDLAALEIFPDGADLAVAISEDLWPNAIKYFLQAQEMDNDSLSDFEEDGPVGAMLLNEEDEVDEEEEEEEDDEDADEAPPAKKRKA